MKTDSFLQLYTASLFNLITPKDDELENQYLSAKEMISKVQFLSEDLKKTIIELEAISFNKKIQKLVISEGDPIAEAANSLNEKIELFETLRGAGKLSIYDITELYFSEKFLSSINELLGKAREQIRSVSFFYKIVFIDLGPKLSELETRLKITQTNLDATLLSRCESEYSKLKSELDGSLKTVTFSKATELAYSRVLKDITILFATLEQQCKSAEKIKSEQDEFERIDAHEKAKQDKERKRLQKLRDEEQLLKEREDAIKRERHEAAQLRLLEKRARALEREEQLKRDYETRVAQFESQLKSASKNSRITVNLLILLISLSTLYFLVSNLISFDASFIAASLYVLFGIAEAQSGLTKVKSKDLKPDFWFQKQTKNPTLIVFTLLAMAIQLIGGLVYALWNWLDPINSAWVGIIFPHTLTNALWYLLAMPLSVLCLMSIPMFMYNVQIVWHSKNRLDTLTTLPLGQDEDAEKLTSAQAILDSPPPIQETISNQAFRSDLCHCGSGKKFKLCHGRFL